VTAVVVGSSAWFGSYGLEQRPHVIFGSAPVALGPPQGILQIPCEHRRRGSDDARSKGNEEAHENPRRPVVFVPEHNDEDYSYRYETDDGYRAMLDGSQRIHGHLRECPILSYVPEQPECPIERYEKRSGTHIHIRQEWIFEVNLEGCGMGIPALDVRFPKHEGKSSDADEHNGYLKK